MKRVTLPNMIQPTVRILLVGPHTYQISFRNIYGYLKTLLFDRCKKVGAQYLYYEKSYVIHSEKLADLKKQFQEVLSMKTNDNKIKFKIEDFPMTNIKMMLKPDIKPDGKNKNKNRIIFIDKSSLNRYFYLKKRIDDTYSDLKKNAEKKQRKITLILTSQINRKFWLSNMLKPQKISGSQQKPPTLSQFPQVTQLTYSELSSKKLQNYHQSTKQTYHQLNKIYLLTYDNLKFVENSWILADVQTVTMLIIDDAEFLVTGQSELSTLENKKRNFEAFKLLLKNYPIDRELLFFLSKIPEPIDLYKLLVLTKPKNFSGIKFSTTLNSCIFNELLFTPQQKCMYDEFLSWFRKRYRSENKCFKEIFYLLKNIVIKTLNQTVFKRTPDLLPSIQLSLKSQSEIKINLLESSSEIVEKFKTMDKKFKKSCPSINLKQILEDFHDNFKSNERRFQVTAKIDDHLLNKHSKNYFFEAKQLMLSSKFEMILKRLFFVVNSQKERICVVLEDQKLEKRLKKYFKETQVEYIDYELPKGNRQIFDNLEGQTIKRLSYSQFDSNFSIKVCIVNINRVNKQYSQISKVCKNFLKRDFQNQFQFYYDHQSSNESEYNIIPRLTTAESVHFIDSFWNDFSYEKEKLLQSIFDFQLSYIEEQQKDSKINDKEVHKNNKITQNYFLFDGSYEKVMLEKYLTRKQQIRKIKIEQRQHIQQNLQDFINTLLIDEKIKFSKCETIDYLDIDEEFDKIEQEAKKMKNNKNLANPMQQKVFLPKFTKPDCKSFKEMLEEKLLQKNIEDILEDQQEFGQYTKKEDLQIKQDRTQNLKNAKEINQEQQILEKANRLQKYDQNDSKQDLTQQKQVSLNGNFEINNVFTDFLIQTPRLQKKNSLSKQEFAIKSNIIQNEPQKDLFDELLGPDFRYDECLKQENCYKKQPQIEEVETEPEIDQDRYLIGPKNWGSKQQAQNQLLLDFGFLAYHNLENQPLKNLSSVLPNSQSKILPIQCNDDSIEIIEATPPSNKRKNPSQKLKNLSNRIRQSQHLSNKMKSKLQKFPFYQLPKQKRHCNKKLYEQAISKSKKLWQKKLRKEKQLLILKTTKFELDLKPMPRWKQNLTSEEIQTLRSKGINV